MVRAARPARTQRASARADSPNILIGKAGRPAVRTARRSGSAPATRRHPPRPRAAPGYAARVDRPASFDPDKRRGRTRGRSETGGRRGEGRDRLQRGTGASLGRRGMRRHCSLVTKIVSFADPPSALSQESIDREEQEEKDSYPEEDREGECVSIEFEAAAVPDD
jgi:hypothetical protein